MAPHDPIEREVPVMRFDPGELQAACPVCGVYTSAPTGQPTPPHQPNGDQTKGMCSGNGQPAI